MRAIALGLVTAAVLAGSMAATAQQRERPSSGSMAATAQQGSRPLLACRADMQTYCKDARGNRGALRECMWENRAKLSPECRKAVRDQRNGPGAGAMPTTTLSYGNDARQAIDFYRAGTTEPAPLIVFIHGGGWSMGDKRQATGEKPAHFNDAGYAFASINYRLVPDATVEQQAHDVANAIDTLRYRAKDLGFDPDRIALMGHSAGAHLAALVGTDPQYLRAAGVPMAAVKAVVLLDGAGYDVSKQMNAGLPMIDKMYRAAFGTDLARQLRLSPAQHVAGPNAASWLILHVATRADAAAQSRQFADGLKKAGSAAEAVAIEDTDHGKLNRNLGTADDPATALVDEFLSRSL